MTRKRWSEEEKEAWVRKIGILNGWGEPSAPFHSCPANIVERCNDSCDTCSLTVGVEKVVKK